MTKNIEKDPTWNLVSITPNFIVKNLQASIAFYVERLGFHVDYQGPDDGPVWGKVSRDGIGIHFKEVHPDVLPLPNRTRHPWAPWDAYIYTLDPDTLFNEFRQGGVSFVKELSFIEEGSGDSRSPMRTGIYLPSFVFATSRAAARIDAMTKLEIFSIMPFFIVRDVPTALAFYRDRFGFEIYGSPFTLNNGLTSSNDQLFHSGLPDIPGENVIGDVFGLALY